MEDTTAYIYGLRAADTDQYFYIGSSRQPPAKRFNDHLSLARNGKHYNRHLMHKMRKVGLDAIALDTIATCTRSEQFELEHQIINDHLQRGHPLTNIRLIPHEAKTAATTPPHYFTPEHLLLGLRYAEQPATALNPHNQELMDLWSQLIRMQFAELQQRFGGRLREKLNTAADLGLSGPEFLEYMEAHMTA